MGEEYEYVVTPVPKKLKAYAKGKQVYMTVPHEAKDDPAAKTWEIVPAIVKSAGCAYICVVPEGRSRGIRYPWNDKVILKHPKDGSFLVPARKQAQQLKAMLEGTAKIEPT